MGSIDELIHNLEKHEKQVADPHAAKRIRKWLERLRDIMSYPEWHHSRGASASGSWRIMAWLERFRQIKAHPQCERAEDLDVVDMARAHAVDSIKTIKAIRQEKPSASSDNELRP
jgi:hypothetical protein